MTVPTWLFVLVLAVVFLAVWIVLLRVAIIPALNWLIFDRIERALRRRYGIDEDGEPR